MIKYYLFFQNNSEIRESGEKADIVSALSFVNDKLSSSEWNTRQSSDVGKAIILITSSSAKDELKTRRFNDVSKSIKNKAHVTVVGLGDAVERGELEAIASDPHNVVTADKEEELLGMVGKIKQSVLLSTGIP